MTRDVLRIVECRPYVEGYGVRVRVSLEYGGTDGPHTRILVRCYVQDQTQPGAPWTEIQGPGGSAYSYCGTPSCCDDADAVDLAISCVSIRPEDTDDEYFESYTPEMLDFCTTHGESLYTDWDSRREWADEEYRRDDLRCPADETGSDDDASGEVVYRLPWLDVSGDDPTDADAEIRQLGSDGEVWT